MTTRKALMAVLAAVVAVAILGACSDKTKVGSGVNTNFNDKLGQRLGEATTTTTSASASNGNAVNATATTRPVAQTTPTTTIKYQEVSLSASGFDTNPIRVYVGTPIRFTNRDTKVRQIEGTNGEFNSGNMAPGAQYVFTPKAPASIDVATDVPFHTTHIDAITH